MPPLSKWLWKSILFYRFCLLAARRQLKQIQLANKQLNSKLTLTLQKLVQWCATICYHPLEEKPLRKKTFWEKSLTREERMGKKDKERGKSAEQTEDRVHRCHITVCFSALLWQALTSQWCYSTDASWVPSGEMSPNQKEHCFTQGQTKARHYQMHTHTSVRTLVHCKVMKITVINKKNLFNFLLFKKLCFDGIWGSQKTKYIHKLHSFTTDTDVKAKVLSSWN